MLTSEKYRNTTQSNKLEQSKFKIHNTRQLHEINRHKWQDNMNLYENQRWNQVFRKGKHKFMFTLYNVWYLRKR